jgi:hypothetical protein
MLMNPAGNLGALDLVEGIEAGRDQPGKRARIGGGTLGSTIAALVARSPCAGSRGGSTATAPRIEPAASCPSRSGR